MRPVNRGPWPQRGGANVTFAPYGEARPYLIARLGDYCSYCGLPLENPQVEHMSPKSLAPALKEDWDNFLLGCVWCNTTKGDKPMTATLLWPDTDNTLRAFDVLVGGRLKVNHRFNPTIRARIEETASLTGLLRYPGGPEEPTASDRRYEKRAVVWRLAVGWRERLVMFDSPALRDAVIDIARGFGFFAVWYHTFKRDPDMCRRLIDAFPGTAMDAFDVSFKLTPRPGGAM